MAGPAFDPVESFPWQLSWWLPLPRLSRYASLEPAIALREEALHGFSDEQLRKESLALRYRAKSGEKLGGLLPEAYALVREAARRTLGMRHYAVQVVGGIALHGRSIAEMETGEGKTLAATLPLYLAALRGKGAHLATVNDYLAARDAEWMGPIYKLLGMSVGVIQAQMPSAERRAAYQCDITYGTAKEFGFDFLRDRLLGRAAQASGGTSLAAAFGGGEPSGLGRGEQPVQRGLFYLLVDEADSILIDEARTPLVISAAVGGEQSPSAATYRWAASVAPRFESEVHFDVDPQTRAIELNFAGRRLARELQQPDVTHGIAMLTIYEYVERAIRVHREMIRDRHYVVRGKEVVIVDEFTGRAAEGRKWRAGLHQAVEAKEGVLVTSETDQAARITIQDFVLRYKHLAGMTGTAATSARELRKIYRLRVERIPTNRSVIRQALPPRIFGNSAAKWQAIVDEVVEVHKVGRPVLIGTRSIDKSEQIAALLASHGIEHEVLNAKQLAREAEIVAQAGQRGRVTVSTNMAGRGTDIRLGPGIAELGGLHIICTEMHDAARIDRQLIGRCGRQGDPGTWRQYLALDDDILREGFGEKRAQRLKRIGAALEDAPARCLALFRRAQKRIELRHFRDRKLLLHREREHKKMQIAMGLDPYLDSPG